MGLQEMVGRGQVRGGGGGGAQGGGGRGQEGRDQALAGGQLQVGGGGGDPLPRRDHAHRDGGVAGAGHDARDVEAGRLPHGLHGLQPPGAGDLAPVASVAAGPAALTVRPLRLLILLHGA